jgi:hypothetical protein
LENRYISKFLIDLLKPGIRPVIPAPVHLNGSIYPVNHPAASSTPFPQQVRIEIKRIKQACPRGGREGVIFHAQSLPFKLAQQGLHKLMSPTSRWRPEFVKNRNIRLSETIRAFRP